MMHDSVMQKFNIHILGEGQQTLVMGHGFGSDQTAWRYQIASLKSRYRIVLFDYLGCGQADISNYSPIHYSQIESYRDDVLEIYEALNLKDTIFIGHSVSAMVGMLVALEHPELIKKLIFIGASPRYLNDGTYIGGFEQSDLDTLYSVMAVNYLGWSNGFAPMAIANPERPELGKEFARTLSAMRPDIAQTTARIIFELDLRHALNGVQQPVLILQSRNDIIVPEAVGSYLAANIPHTKLVLLNAEGHLPHLSAPDAVLDAIEEYLSDPTI